MKTWSGNWAPLTHQDGQVNLLDVLIGAGRENRWGNWGSTEYKVLHHSMLVALIWLKAGFSPSKAVYALLHDGHEAYSGDIPTPVKKLLGYEKITEIQRQFDEVIRQALGRYRRPSKRTLERIRLCDEAALIIEAPFFGPPEAYEVILPDIRPEVMKLVRKVMPDFEETIQRRAGPHG